jgi:hypothetical protein
VRLAARLVPLAAIPLSCVVGAATMAAMLKLTTVVLGLAITAVPAAPQTPRGQPVARVDNGAPLSPTPAAAQTAKPTTCDSAEHRQFDFWLGEWDVTTPDGKPAGRNVITRELKGCVLHERWTGAGGMNGESFNMWDAVRKRWHQTWVSDSGNLLLLDGAFQNGAMQLVGVSGPTDRPATNRITWTPAADGTVRQHWEVSADGGQTWKSAFDGRYRRAMSR